MGLITDVKHELTALDLQPKALRKFGLMVGGVLLLLTWIAWRRHWGTGWEMGLGISGGLLVIFGATFPALLRPVYRVWMGMSFTLGWFMSRVLLTLLFFGALVPVALVGKVLGLPFARMRRPEKRDSYWMERKPRPANHHEEMF